MLPTQRHSRVTGPGVCPLESYNHWSWGIHKPEKSTAMGELSDEVEAGTVGIRGGAGGWWRVENRSSGTGNAKWLWSLRQPQLSSIPRLQAAQPLPVCSRLLGSRTVLAVVTGQVSERKGQAGSRAHEGRRRHGRRQGGCWWQSLGLCSRH